MKNTKIKKLLTRAAKLMVLASIPLLAATAAQAQATRTWVSGVGDDASPCSRTAPCKTFAGAISKTAAGGQINAIDPGGFGAVTINKAITIDGAGTHASVLVSGSSGITINAPASAVVVLRNIDIVSAPPPSVGLNGIRFIAGAALHLENVGIREFTESGVLFAPSGNSELFVSNSSMRNNARGGIDVIPSGIGTARVTINNVMIARNGRGMRIENGSTVFMQDSTISGSLANGFVTLSTGGPIKLTLERVSSVNNGDVGVRSDGTGSQVRMSDCTVSGNTNGLLAVNGGSIRSFGNNRVSGNAVDGIPDASAGGI